MSNPVPIPLKLAENTPVLDSLKRPLRELRVSVIDRCNFRCPYFYDRFLVYTNYFSLLRAEVNFCSR